MIGDAYIPCMHPSHKLHNLSSKHTLNSYQYTVPLSMTCNMFISILDGDASMRGRCEVMFRRLF